MLVAVPQSIKMAITVGIGLFITIIGFKLANLVAVTVNVAPDADLSKPIPGSAFNLSLGNFVTHHDALLALIGSR